LGTERPDVSETFQAPDREAWRAWLAQHHASRDEVWLLMYKKHVDRPCVTLEEAVEEALCFGWIDGKLYRVDDEKHVLRFTPRRPGSVWSKTNKERVARLEAAGLMTAAGRAAVAAAKRSGQWRRADERERVGAPPADLEKALRGDARARACWGTLAPSHKKTYIHWILDAKRAETRERRVAETVRRLAAGRRPGIDEHDAVVW
jgi:uncharacterized protein YdeI (YjbR/CyaY-like superfamily)